MKQPSEKQLSFLAFVRDLKVSLPEKPKEIIKKTPAHKKEKKERWKVFLDGASRGNPGLAGVGIYIVDHHEKVLLKQGLYLGNNKTNNQAEYLALAFALFLLEHDLLQTKADKPTITFISDSELLIKQMNGLYRVKNPILAHIKSIIDTMLKNLDYEFKHVVRENNVMADALANTGIDKKRKPSPKLLKFSSDNNLV